MPRKTIEISINPSVLEWARKIAGFEVEEVAKRIDRKVETVKEWESGARNPTLKILEELALFYKRPLAVFFLPEQPHDLPMPEDFRVLPGKERPPLSSESRIAIRRASRFQSLAQELMKNLGSGAPVNIGKANTNESPEELAVEQRKYLEISIDEQFAWKSPHMAFNQWRRAIENFNIPVFQMRMPVEEVRGFSLIEGTLPAIIVNSSDSIHARIFTLFHEYAHLLLGTAGICMPDERSYGDAYLGKEVEKFSNHFAGALLVPKDALHNDVKPVAYSLRLDDHFLSQIAARYKVSRHVILRRMQILDLISISQYQNKLEKWESQERAKGQKRKLSFSVGPAKRCMQEKGRLFISLVLEAKEREIITYSDVADYLCIKMKYLDEVRSLIS